MYLQCQSNESTGRTATIVFYAICVLYVLSTVNFISDVAVETLEVSNTYICSKISYFLSIVQSRISAPISYETVQCITSGCCDFLAQCILVRINH